MQCKAVGRWEIVYDQAFRAYDMVNELNSCEWDELRLPLLHAVVYPSQLADPFEHVC